MIKLFTIQGNWTVDQFRLALSHISRAQLTAFLDKRGPKQGIHTQAFELGWEFFKKYELLGTPNPPALQHALENRGILQERNPNRGRKRTSIGGEEQPVKHTRVAHSGDKSVVTST
ncbi:hypothetical protein F4818DRAFT_437851 [Hypoxylon cercidicola]|nr:hypothetical protein F4818DRAFT_437851 [Hypoxylon cercidicola]